MCAGHPLRSRLGHYRRSPQTEKDFCPTLLLFLECVYQLHQQQPSLLELNALLLLMVAQHAQTLLFGTFLCNCEAERRRLDLRGHTESLWSYINADVEEYKNPFYAPERVDQNKVYANPTLIRMRPWEELHMRWLLPMLNNKKSGPDENVT